MNSPISDPVEECYRNLCVEIVFRAVEDFKFLVDHGYESHCTSNMQASRLDLIRFFKSDWCEELLLHTSLCKEDIITQMKQYEKTHDKKSEMEWW